MVAQALVSLALIGKDNEPLYLRDFIPASEDDAATDAAANSSSVDDDPFGFMPCLENESCLRNHFIIHASLDAFEEQLALKQQQSSSSSSSNSHDSYMGLLCPIEELRVYGYMTKTGVKIIAMLEDTLDFYQFQRESSGQSREAELKSLFAKIHVLFVEYTLNPFAKLKGKIQSKRFNDGVERHVKLFNGQK
mmetsp:Transcript_23330/g.35982  ORF Transcript_23330/g.35982 Transcript_23330/m.35982 type:complete len:192 (+) Transcript_23330:150-725(+)|eukprot:CAMPEP_0196824394 /NCGR_PEP_ID=MMETSP1362-20130617/91654_1 /TAXON_ID=163516 /ORGANISM="Leptocylindrus danicus, Strain CCMP1856" /LENGTH=191 /DNA_ID=CAMNT_0042204637 /DNA_START=70 /DNA_END=645 /DNA_ORIENTATION=-